MESHSLNIQEASDWNVIRAYQKVLPVDVVGLAGALGIRVYDAKFGDDVSGILRKDSQYGGSKGYSILVNHRHPLNRKRFTIAHEIAHFVLHRDRTGEEVKDDMFYRSETLPSPLEREANEMAAKILMPQNLLSQLRAEGITDLEEMAARLKVSRQALAIRLGIPYDQTWD